MQRFYVCAAAEAVYLVADTQRSTDGAGLLSAADEAMEKILHRQTHRTQQYLQL